MLTMSKNLSFEKMRLKFLIRYVRKYSKNTIDGYFIYLQKFRICRLYVKYLFKKKSGCSLLADREIKII